MQYVINAEISRVFSKEHLLMREANRDKLLLDIFNTGIY